MAKHNRDMYGHLIHVSDDGREEFGVSMSWHTVPPSTRKLPTMNVFHESDGFQQSLFSITIIDKGPDWGGERPVIVNVFEDRLREVLDMVNDVAPV